MKKLVSLFLCVMMSLCGCGDGNNLTKPNKNENDDDIGMTVQDAMAKKDFIGPDNVSPTKKNIFIGIKSDTKVFDIGSEIEYYVMVMSELKADLNLEINLKNEFASSSAQNKHTLKANRELQTIAGKIKSDKRGIAKFNVVIKDSLGAVVMDESKDVAIMDIASAPSSDDFYWGVQPFVIRAIEYNEGLSGAHCFSNLTAEETYALTFDYIDKTGANVIRDGTVWTSNQPSQSVSNFSLMDRFVKDAKTKGYMIDWTLGGTPDWAVEDRFANAEVKWNKPPKLSAWESYIQKVTEKYSSDEHVMMEIINECNWPDFFYGSADEFINIMKSSVNAIKAKNPNTIVLNGGMVMPQANNYVTEESEKFEFKEDYKYYELYGELIAGNKMPFVSYHSHAKFKTFIEKDAVNMMYYLKDNGIAQDKLFLNESGMFSADGMIQADDVIKKALWSKCNDSKGFVLFNFRDIDGGVLSPPGWGIITRDGQPKASYVAYTNAIKLLSGYKNKKVYANSLYNAYLMDNGSKNTLVLFRDKSVQDVVVNLPQGKSFKAYDMFGNELSSGYDKMGEFPVYIVFDGQIDANSVTFTKPSGKLMISEYDRIDNFPKK